MWARLLSLFLVLACSVGGVQAAEFVIGIHPIHSMRTLAERFEPLRAYLERRLGQPAIVESAVSFATYYTRTLQGDFDLAIIPAHLARLAQQDRGFQPLVQFLPDNDALLISSVERPLWATGTRQQLAVIDPLAVTVMAVMRHLREQGLVAGRDYAVTVYHSHLGVVLAVVTGQALVGVTTTHALQQIPQDLRDRLKVVTRLTDIPSFVALAKPGITRGRAQQLRDLLLAFSRETAGREFLQGIAFEQFVPADEPRMQRVDAYLEETRRGLQR